MITQHTFTSPLPIGLLAREQYHSVGSISSDDQAELDAKTEAFRTAHQDHAIVIRFVRNESPTQESRGLTLLAFSNILARTYYFSRGEGSSHGNF